MVNKKITKVENVKTLMIIILVIAGIFFSIWILRLSEEITDLKIQQSIQSYTPLSSWDKDPEWSFEHLWYDTSRFMAGRINNERYILKYDNWNVNESFELTFDFDGTCEILLFNNSCESMTQDGCHNSYVINGNVTEGWLKF